MSDFIWVEKYRPETIDDCILPQNIKKTFQGFVDSGQIPNMLLSGLPGVGKTTVAKALCKQLGVDCLVINGSDEGRFLDTVRNNAKTFASTVSLFESEAKHKVIIIDEADNTGKDVQLSLRAFIEEFSNNCRFIFTCNYKYKIIDPLHSRCVSVDFSINPEDRSEVSHLFFKRIKYILENENIEYEDIVLAKLIKSYFQDWRRILNECQRYSVCGKIDSGILAEFADVAVDDLITYLKEKNFNSVRKWATDHYYNGLVMILRKIYDVLVKEIDGPSIAAIVLIIAKYDFQSERAADQELHLLAALTEIMVECNFK